MLHVFSLKKVVGIPYLPYIVIQFPFKSALTKGYWLTEFAVYQSAHVAKQEMNKDSWGKDYANVLQRSVTSFRHKCLAEGVLDQTVLKNCSPPAIEIASLKSCPAQVLRGLPLRRGPFGLTNLKELAWKIVSRITLLDGILATSPIYSNCCLRTCWLKRIAPAVARTVLLETLLRYECGVPVSFRRHLAWNASSFWASAVLSHVVCKQYKSFVTTHAWNTSCLRMILILLWPQTLLSVSNSAFAAPSRWFSSAPTKG